jgi:hypothetical protein
LVSITASDRDSSVIQLLIYGQEIHPFKTFSSTEGPPHFIFGGYPGAVFVGVNRPALEDENSPAFSAEVENEWRYTSIRPCMYVIVVCTGTLPLT